MPEKTIFKKFDCDNSKIIMNEDYSALVLCENYSTSNQVTFQAKIINKDNIFEDEIGTMVFDLKGNNALSTTKLFNIQQNAELDISEYGNPIGFVRL